MIGYDDEAHGQPPVATSYVLAPAEGHLLAKPAEQPPASAPPAQSKGPSLAEMATAAARAAREEAAAAAPEGSDDSDDEKELDGYLQSKITNYIDNKSVRDLVNQGLLEPQPIFQ